MRQGLLAIALATIASWPAAGVDAAGEQAIATREAVLFKAFENRVFDDQLPAVLATLTPDVRTEIVRRLARREMYVAQTPLPPPAAELPSRIVLDVRRSIEVGMVAMLETRGMPDEAQRAIEREAFEYARHAKVYYEWEGYQDGPFEEAAAALAYLTAHPHSALGPYLDLFILHRYRSAFEAAVWEAAHGKTPEMTDAQGVAKHAADLADARRAAQLYRQQWARVSASTDPVAHAIALDLDRASRAYLDVGVHPQAYGGEAESRKRGDVGQTHRRFLWRISQVATAEES